MTRLLFLLTLFGACSRPDVKPSELARYVSDPKESKLWAQSEADDFLFTLRYQPSSLLAVNGLGDRCTKADYEQRAREFTHAEHFVLTVTKSSGETQKALRDALGAKYDSVYNTLMFEYASRVSLRCGSDVFPCAIYHLENDGNIRDGYTAVIGFEIGDVQRLKDDRTVMIDDDVFTNRPVTLTISSEAIDNIPTLAINNETHE